MALPNPIPDNPQKWEGWRTYNSPNLYERLGIDATSNPTDEVIENNCRELLVWWSKKLPLKNQPSNPVAQLLRQGLNDAFQMITEARTRLLDPVERPKVDAELHVHLVKTTSVELKKLIAFVLGEGKLTEEGEKRLFNAGRSLGLRDEDIVPVIEEELTRTGAVRVKDEPPPPPPPPAEPAPVAVAPPAPAADPAASAAAGDPFYEFRKILRMSRLSIDGDDMTDDQRDAMCNLGESLGLTGGQAEDLIDEYLEQMANAPISAPAPAPSGHAPKPAGSAPSQMASGTAPKSVIGPARKVVVVSPMARLGEKQKYPPYRNFAEMEMLLVPSSKFTMGSDASDAHINERPLTDISISCFYISRYPVTNAQFERFNSSHFNKRAPWADDNHPVVYVTATEADAFCRWLSEKEKKNYRLPSEAEWELAARGEDGRTFPWGESLKTGDRANFADMRTNFAWKDLSIDDGYAETAPVGKFPRGVSPFGIEDMAGNVFEWTSDTIEPYTGKESTNRRVKTVGNRIYRGGSWRSRANSLRTTARNSNLVSYQSNDVGFRVVCECD